MSNLASDELIEKLHSAAHQARKDGQSPAEFLVTAYREWMLTSDDAKEFISTYQSVMDIRKIFSPSTLLKEPFDPRYSCD